MQTVHLNIAWLSSDSKIYLAKRAHCASDASHDTLFSLQTRRTLWKLGMSAKTEGFNVAIGKYEDPVKAGVVHPAKVVRTVLQNAARSPSFPFFSLSASRCSKPSR